MHHTPLFAVRLAPAVTITLTLLLGVAVAQDDKGKRKKRQQRNRPPAEQSFPNPSNPMLRRPLVQPVLVDTPTPPPRRKRDGRRPPPDSPPPQSANQDAAKKPGHAKPPKLAKSPAVRRPTATPAQQASTADENKGDDKQHFATPTPATAQAPTIKEKPASSTSATGDGQAGSSAGKSTGGKPLRYVDTKVGKIPIYNEDEAPAGPGDVEADENGNASWVGKNGMVVRGRLTQEQLKELQKEGVDPDTAEELNKGGRRAIVENLNLRANLEAFGVEPGKSEEVADAVSKKGTIKAKEDALRKGLVDVGQAPKGLVESGRSLTDVLDILATYKAVGGEDSSKIPPEFVQDLDNLKKGKGNIDPGNVLLKWNDKFIVEGSSGTSSGNSGSRKSPQLSPEAQDLMNEALKKRLADQAAPKTETSRPPAKTKTPEKKPPPPKRLWVIGGGEGRPFLPGPKNDDYGTSYPPGSDKVDLGEMVITPRAKPPGRGKAKVPEAPPNAARLHTLPTAPPKDAFDLPAGQGRSPGSLPSLTFTPPPSSRPGMGGTGTAGAPPPGLTTLRPGEKRPSTGGAPPNTGTGGTTGSSGSSTAGQSGNSASERQANQAEQRMDRINRDSSKPAGGSSTTSTAPPTHPEAPPSNSSNAAPSSAPKANVDVPEEEIVVRNEPPADDDSSPAPEDDDETSPAPTGTDTEYQPAPDDDQGTFRGWNSGFHPGIAGEMNNLGPKKGDTKGNPGEQGNTGDTAGSGDRPKIGKDAIINPGGLLEPKVNLPPPDVARPGSNPETEYPAPDATDQSAPVSGDSEKSYGVQDDRESDMKEPTDSDGDGGSASGSSPTATPVRTSRPSDTGAGIKSPTPTPTYAPGSQQYMAPPSNITPPPSVSPSASPSP